jgi:hypothetical protein
MKRKESFERKKRAMEINGSHTIGSGETRVGK